MTGRAFRALCVAGLFAFAANGARADSAAQTTQGAPLDLTSYSTTANFDAIAPRARLAGQFDLGPSDALPDLSLGLTQSSLYDVSGHLPLLDDISLDFGFNNAASTQSGAQNHLMLSPALPYATLTGGTSYLGVTADLTDALHLSLGESSLGAADDTFETGPQAALLRMGGLPDLYDTREAHSLLAGVSLDVAPWGGVSFSTSQTSEHDGLLGGFNPAVRSADTSALSVSARILLGGGWVTTASYAEAITKLDLKPGFHTASDDSRTASYSFAVAKGDLFGHDMMGFTVSRPAGGSNNSGFSLLSGGAQPPAWTDTFVIDAQAPETDFELGYVTTFLDGSVALQTNAAYQMNFQGQTGNNAVSFLSRAKIKF